MANFGKGKVLTGKNLKESQKRREAKGDRRPAKNRQFTDELFTYKRGSVYRGKQYWIFENDITAFDISISEESFKKYKGKIKDKEIKITAKNNKKGSLSSIKSIEIIKEK